MELIYSPDTRPEAGSAIIGGKGKTLIQLYNKGLPVARPFCIGTGGYDLFIEQNQLREKIYLELYRKEIKDMRWEEIWDISLRIQNLFMTGHFPSELDQQIENKIRPYFKDKSLVVRSSAPDEDGNAHSFAGLHESYLNVAAGNELYKKIKKVWASLWSDRAILYRQELGLEVTSSKMAVVIQEFVEGDCSGIVFSQNPLEASQVVIEAVHGLNQGLVDGAVEPDRWILDRNGELASKHYPPTARTFHFVRSGHAGIERKELTNDLKVLPPISESKVQEVAQLGKRLEDLFHIAQDAEWTFAGNTLSLLQSRPITAKSGVDKNDKRSWYLSLNRSYDNLLELWENIAQTLLPQMDQEFSRLAEMALDNLSDEELAEELTRRSARTDKWTATYWSEFIPFAHGVRLFGEMYNDVVEPDDPFEFVLLLTRQDMLSTRRNAVLYECAQLVNADASLYQSLLSGALAEIDNDHFQRKVEQLKMHFSMAGVGAGDIDAVNELIAAIILEYSAIDCIESGQGFVESKELETRFLQKGRDKLPVDPAKLLEMARASYRIRDDDNIHIGRISQELERAKTESRKRLQSRGISTDSLISVDDLSRMLLGKITSDVPPKQAVDKVDFNEGERVRARQIQGQAASRGIAKGKARVVRTGMELKDFKKGEVLVIDSIDPTLTFFAPLASGIIERRGGMLIHGAIIAREYGIPCITGVVDATVRIKTGDVVTVDGYLGICTIQRE